MSVPTPEELIDTYGRKEPEALAHDLGFEIVRETPAPELPGVRVSSEFRPTRTILLYEDALRDQAARRHTSLYRLEQWHIAHELYHGLAEAGGTSPWRAIETAADLWADELMTLAIR